LGILDVATCTQLGSILRPDSLEDIWSTAPNIDVHYSLKGGVRLADDYIYGFVAQMD
jgi:hypothetical protein